MMCIGWKTKQTCKVRGEVTVEPGQQPCASIAWFWWAAALIGLGAMVKK